MLGLKLENPRGGAGGEGCINEHFQDLRQGNGYFLVVPTIHTKTSKQTY